MPSGPLPVMSGIVRATYQFQQYVPLSKQFTAAFNVEIGVGASGSDKTYPVFKNFFGGGLGSVRGFEQGSLGPVDISGTTVGGTSKVQSQHGNSGAVSRGWQRPHFAPVWFLGYRHGRRA